MICKESKAKKIDQTAQTSQCNSNCVDLDLQATLYICNGLICHELQKQRLKKHVETSTTVHTHDIPLLCNLWKSSPNKKIRKGAMIHDPRFNIPPHCSVFLLPWRSDNGRNSIVSHKANFKSFPAPHCRLRNSRKFCKKKKASLLLAAKKWRSRSGIWAILEVVCGFHSATQI